MPSSTCLRSNCTAPACCVWLLLTFTDDIVLQVVDEFLFEFTHNTKMDWMLPGIEPTGKFASVPFIVVVKFAPGTDKLLAERIYWDQATVLQQLGLLQAHLPCVTGAEQAKKAFDHDAVPSNYLIKQTLNGSANN